MSDQGRDEGGISLIYNKIKCEAINVNTESGVCPGVAKTERGETFI
jgi:hypothetical protein